MPARYRVKIIALEEHMFPRFVLDSYGLDLGPRVGQKIAELDDVAEGRLAMMDVAGVEIQVLSALGSIVQDLEPVLSTKASIEINDHIARAIQAFPDRFRGFALLPVSDPERSVAELRRCVEELGFVGAMVHGQTHGVFLDDPSMRPLLAEAVRLDVPIYIHPAPPPSSVHEAYFSGLSPAIATCLSTAGWGWHSECGLHVVAHGRCGCF
jgi:predicted TIM-barrel fold metal-dependent hydrolase